MAEADQSPGARPRRRPYGARRIPRQPLLSRVPGDGLKRPTEQAKSPRWVRLVHAVLATLQTIAAPLLFLLLVLIGLAAMLGIAWGTGWLIAKPFDLLGLHGVATGIRLWMVGSIAFAIFVSHRR